MGDHDDDGEATPDRRGRRPQRTHRGRTVEERRSERRVALREAGLDLFGTVGLAGTSITEVCRRSSVTTRYFYEEYGSLEALLVDVFDGLARDVVADALAYGGSDDDLGDAHAVLRARTAGFLHAITADERVARVVLLESGSTTLAERRHRARQVLVGFIVRKALELLDDRRADGNELRLVARLYVGAVEGAALDWVSTPPADRLDIDRIVDHLVDMAVAVLMRQRA